MTAPLTPTLPLSDIYGPGHAYVPRVHPTANLWVPSDPAMSDIYTGGQLAVLGSMPAVCSAGVATPAALDLLSEAGLTVGPHLLVYRTYAEMDAIVRNLAAQGQRLVLQHSFPTGTLPDGAAWIDDGLQAFLNNKASIEALTPPEATPRRRLVEPASFFADPPPPPFVLKVATGLSTAAGCDVLICRRPDDLARADAFRKAETLVVEELLPIARNLCLHFTVGADRTVRYVGTAPQQVGEDGHYEGNWLLPEDPAPAEAIAVGTEIARQGAALGYYGWVGIDMAVLEDGTVRAFDLNFRVNGSTTAVLLADAVRRRHPGAVLRSRGWSYDGSARELADVARRWMRDGVLIPLSLFDPEAAGHPDYRPRLSGLLVGGSVKDIESLEAALPRSGLR